MTAMTPYLSVDEFQELKSNVPVLACVTPAFRLRGFRNNDQERVDLMDQIRSSRVWERVSNVPNPYTMTDAIKWTLYASFNLAEPRFDFVISVGGRLAGSIAFINIDYHKAQLSYWLGEEHQGKGIMVNAVKMITKFGFETCGFVRIWGYTHDGNIASQSVLQKAGFSFEGVHKKEWLKDNQYRDSHMYAIVR